MASERKSIVDELVSAVIRLGGSAGELRQALDDLGISGQIRIET
jgi:hypothetical protein